MGNGTNRSSAGENPSRTTRTARRADASWPPNPSLATLLGGCRFNTVSQNHWAALPSSGGPKITSVHWSLFACFSCFYSSLGSEMYCRGRSLFIPLILSSSRCLKLGSLAEAQIWHLKKFVRQPSSTKTNRGLTPRFIRNST